MDATEIRIVETERQLAVHEAVCAQRYEAIQKRFDDGSKRMKRIEYILYLVAAATFIGADNLEKLIKALIGV
jgi:hypothetical protein